MTVYPKSKQLYHKRKEKKQVYKGRTIPTKKQRSAITKREYNRAIEAFGDTCAICSNPRIEMHHIKYRSQGGKGGYRNLIPLCNKHHRQAHTSRDLAEQFRFERKLMFGEWYWADRYDLFQAGLIPNTTQETFEKFMEEDRHDKKRI